MSDQVLFLLVKDFFVLDDDNFGSLLVLFFNMALEKLPAIVCCTSSNLDISQRMHIETFPLCSGMKDLQTPHANVGSKNSMKATFHWKTNTGKDGQ